MTIRWKSALAAALVVGLSGVVPGVAYADPGGRSTDNVEPKNTPAQEAADALGPLGLNEYSDTFSGMRVDAGSGRLTVYATDPTQAALMTRSGSGSRSSALWRQVKIDVRQSKYTRKQLEAAREELWRAAEPGSVFAISVPSDGSGLVVEVADPTNAPARTLMSSERLSAGVVSTDVRFVAGRRMRPVSRENDSAPYKGGIPIEGFWDSDWRCTSAFGMRKDGKTYLITAEHCFDDIGDWVYDRNDDYIGSLSFENNVFDAAAIETSAGPTVWIDDEQTRVFQRAALSWNGQYVCQSGFTSNKICTIEVTEDNVQWDFGDGKGVRQGVRGRRGAGSVSVCSGDSGGPVWTYSADSVFESRGIVSAGWNTLNEDLGCDEYIGWTETPFVLNHFGGSLITG